MSQAAAATSKEVSLDEDEFIVSKTDASGRIKYINRVFMHISGFPESELLGQQHNIIRHPDMPRGVFKMLWDTLKSGNEFFGYVKNICKDGGYYWVYANITSDYDEHGNLRGYYSVRRKPKLVAVTAMADIYRQMLVIENSAGRKSGPSASVEFLNDILKSQHVSYNAFVQKMDKE